MLTRIAFALVALVASAIGGGVPSTQPATRPTSRPAQHAGPASAPSTAPAPPEWDNFVRCYDAAVKYYRDYGGWKPATGAQDKKIAGDLGKALGELWALVLSTEMGRADWEFAHNEVLAIDFLGGRSSRNTVVRTGTDGKFLHADYMPGEPGVSAYRALRDQIAHLEDMSLEGPHIPAVRQWAAERVRERARVLGTAAGAESADWEANRIRREKDPNTVAPVDTRLLRAKALSLVAKIEAMDKPATTP